MRSGNDMSCGAMAGILVIVLCLSLSFCLHSGTPILIALAICGVIIYLEGRSEREIESSNRRADNKVVSLGFSDIKAEAALAQGFGKIYFDESQNQIIIINPEGKHVKLGPDSILNVEVNLDIDRRITGKTVGSGFSVGEVGIGSSGTQINVNERVLLAWLILGLDNVRTPELTLPFANEREARRWLRIVEIMCSRDSHVIT
ncbi:MAG: hypothetical protein KF824_12615 [Fimbriimonadaceae bacterium]|nr:MAG: hypothetical protein KF824_12615 [Fimbriimonadaceae bacterium]